MLLKDSDRAEMIQTLIENAGDSLEMPPPPKGGIPKQRVSGWIRWPIRAVLLPFVLLDLSMQKVAKMLLRPPFRQIGKCLKRGNCCHYILLQYSKGWLGKLFLFWNTQINGFYLRDSDPHEFDGKKVLVMGCRYLQSDGKCKHYRFRPAVCRQWPLIEYFGRPQILKGCGFRPISRFESSNDSTPSKMKIYS